MDLSLCAWAEPGGIGRRNPAAQSPKPARPLSILGYSMADIGIMQNKMETTKGCILSYIGLYCIGIMENKMEAPIKFRVLGWAVTVAYCALARKKGI